MTRRTMPEGSILVADDDPKLGEFLDMLLSSEGYRVRLARDGREALDLIEDNPPDVALVDLKMPKIDGLELLKTIKDRWPEIVSIMITAYGTLDSALAATRLGVYEYIKKPCENDQILSTVRRAFELKSFDNDSTEHES
jgi:DNA-binding NtrC family response regulator